MPNWKDDNEYAGAWGKARDGMNSFPPNSQHAGQYAEGWGHVFRNRQAFKGGREGGPSAQWEMVKPSAPRPHAEGETVLGPPKPARTPAWQRGLVQGMMWRRKNPRFY